MHAYTDALTGLSNRRDQRSAGDREFRHGGSTMGATFDEILRAADAALYHSKNSGRDRATVGTKTVLQAACS